MARVGSLLAPVIVNQGGGAMTAGVCVALAVLAFGVVTTWLPDDREVVRDGGQRLSIAAASSLDVGVVEEGVGAPCGEGEVVPDFDSLDSRSRPRKNFLAPI